MSSIPREDRAGAAATETIDAPAPRRAARSPYPRILRWIARLPFPDAAGPSPRPQKALVRGWYQFLSFMDRRVHMVFMNYGYAPPGGRDPGLVLRADDEKDRYCIQLYHRVAGAVDLAGKDVLEVGSGRGGGASFVARYLGPRSMVGVDFAANAVGFCNRRYRTETLSYVRGDAEDLPLADRSFDVVLNVESSHCYPSVGRFLREAARVLRPGGHLLFADMRHRADLDPLRDAFRDAGLAILHEEEITAEVIRALELDNDRKLGLIRREVPAIFRPLFRCFAGIKDTSSYDSFRAGEWVYWRFVLRRDPEEGP